jgi:hypothetical protein
MKGRCGFNLQNFLETKDLETLAATFMFVNSSSETLSEGLRSSAKAVGNKVRIAGG